MIPEQSSISVERWMERLPLARHWTVALIGTVLLLIPVCTAIADDALLDLVTERQGRYLFFPPLMILYLLLILPPLERTRRSVLCALRPLIELDDDELAAIVSHSCRRRVGLELLGLVIGGGLLAIILGRPEVEPLYPVSSIYIYTAMFVMGSAIGWCVAIVFEITVLTRTLLHQPIQVDVLDITPFESIGKQSMWLTIIFLGATILSLLFVFSPAEAGDFLVWDNLVIYGVMISLSVLAFFLGMYDTHHLLSGKKKEAAALTQQRLSAAYVRLHQTVEGSSDAQSAAIDFSAWTAAKQEMRTARTWPYNTEMLRTLVVSGLVPILVALARIAAIWFA